MHCRCFLFFYVSFRFLKLSNALVVHVDLQRYRPEFRAFHSIMRQMMATKTITTLRDTDTLNFVISTTAYVVDMIPRLNLDQHRELFRSSYFPIKTTH